MWSELSISLSVPEALMAARCAHEDLCGNIGPQQEYESADDCLVAVTVEWQHELEARECPDGRHQMELERCISAIVEHHSCEDSSQALNGSAGCATAELCAAVVTQ